MNLLNKIRKWMTLPEPRDRSKMEWTLSDVNMVWDRGQCVGFFWGVLFSLGFRLLEFLTRLVFYLS